MLYYEVYIFIDTYHCQGGDKLKKPIKDPFYIFSLDDTEGKVAVRFECEKGQDAIYEITLCQYLDPENELLIDPSIRFLWVAHLE